MENLQKENLINQVQQRHNLIAAHLSEKDKRLWGLLQRQTQ